jgi:hypothetical protein
VARQELIRDVITDKFRLSASPALVLDPYKEAPITALIEHAKQEYRHQGL